MAAEIQTREAPRPAAPLHTPSGAAGDPGQTKKRAGRGAVSIAGEKLIEALIRLCGICAIIFVFSIFFFVFREAVPLFFEEPKAPAQEQAAAVERHADEEVNRGC